MNINKSFTTLASLTVAASMGCSGNITTHTETLGDRTEQIVANACDDTERKLANALAKVEDDIEYMNDGLDRALRGETIGRDQAEIRKGLLLINKKQMDSAEREHGERCPAYHGIINSWNEPSGIKMRVIRVRNKLEKLGGLARTN